MPVDLPYLEGQPGWVVVVVVGLLVLGGLGLAWLRRDPGAAEVRPELTEQGSATLTGEAGHAAVGDTIKDAMRHLADVALREAAEAEAERRRADVIQSRLEECAAELLTLRRLAKGNESED